MPKVTEQYREARRVEIARAALRAFQRKGFQATSMADIIAESGLSAGAIYGHFGGKAEIASEAARSIISSRILNLAELAKQEPMLAPGELLAQFLSALVDEIPDTSVLLQLWGEGTTEPSMREVALEVMQRLRSAFAEHIERWLMGEGADAEQAAAESRRLAPLFIGVCQGFVVQRTLIADFDADAYLEAAASLLPR